MPVGTYDPDAMTCREPQRPDEQAAKQLVQLCLPEVEVCLHDDGSRPMLYDLELRWPDGRVEAMEVTTDTDEVWQLVGSRLDRQGPVMAVESAHSWVVLLAEGNTDVRLVRARIDHLLSLVEQAGRTRISRREERGSPAVARVRRLGVDYGYTYKAADGQPKIRIMLPMRGWFVRAEAVNEAVERHAELNAAKLARSGCNERHLFMLVASVSMEAWSGLMEREPPEAPPRLPEAVTTAWAAGYRSDGRPVVWRARRPGRWDVLL
jgi:hypothetical protein